MDVVSRAEALVEEIQADIAQTGSGSVHPIDPGTGTGAGTGSGSATGQEDELIAQAREFVDALTVQVQTRAVEADESKLERLLELCDQLNGGIDTLAVRAARRARVHGLGLKVDGLPGVGGEGGTALHEDGENLPPTPRVDKGKGRAEPEPEEPEKVLSPTFMITESEDEDEDDHRYLDVEEGEDESGGVQVTSPTDRYVGRAGGPA